MLFGFYTTENSIHIMEHNKQQYDIDFIIFMNKFQS